VDIRGKIINALLARLDEPYIRLEDGRGISGFVVSPQFEGMSTFDRQVLIEDALRNAPEPLDPEERRRILMIAGLTPAESDATGAGVRIYKLKAKPDGTIEVLLHGGTSDAEYVREAFKSLKNVETSEPEHSEGARGILMSFRAKGTPADPLTKAKARQVLRSDPYITVMPGA